GPGPDDQIEGFVVSGALLGGRQAIGVEVLSAGADKADDESSLRKVVYHGELFGHAERVTVERKHDAHRYKLDSLGDARRRGEHHHRRGRESAIGTKVVLREDQSIEAERIHP